jgi:hypothetical protein
MKKPRNFTREEAKGFAVLPPKEKLDTMTDLVEMVRAPLAKGIITHFIKEFDLRRIKNSNDLAAGYHGVFTMILHLGILGKDVRDTCELLLKALNGFSSHRRGYLEVEFPQELEERFEAALSDIHGALEKVLRPDEYKRISQMLGITEEDGTPKTKTLPE